MRACVCVRVSGAGGEWFYGILFSPPKKTICKRILNSKFRTGTRTSASPVYSASIISSVSTSFTSIIAARTLRFAALGQGARSSGGGLKT